MHINRHINRHISLTQYLVEQQREHGRIPAQLRLLIEVVARACKHIAIAVNKGALRDVLEVSEKHFLQPGKHQAAAGYCVYGAQTTPVLTLSNGMALFTLDRETVRGC